MNLCTDNENSQLIATKGEEENNDDASHGNTDVKIGSNEENICGAHFIFVRKCEFPVVFSGRVVCTTKLCTPTTSSEVISQRAHIWNMENKQIHITIIHQLTQLRVGR